MPKTGNVNITITPPSFEKEVIIILESVMAVIQKIVSGKVTGKQMEAINKYEFLKAGLQRIN